MAAAEVGKAKVRLDAGVKGHQVSQPGGGEVGRDQVKEAMADGYL